MKEDKFWLVIPHENEVTVIEEIWAIVCIENEHFS